MPRHARKGLNASFFHVMCQGINKEYIFEMDSFKNMYLYLMKKHINKVELDVICYCIMDNHVHILIHTDDIRQLSKYMKCINTEYANFYNLKKERVGFVFRDRFKSQYIYDEKYLMQCSKYIHMNPVKAGIVENCGDYKYSSYNELKKGTLLGKTSFYYSVFIDATEKIENCSDFIDIDYDIDKVIDEYIEIFCKKRNTNIAEIKQDITRRNELIRAILKSGNIKKIDIKNKLNISYWQISRALENKG